MLPVGRQQYLELRRNLGSACDPLLERIDGAEGNGISVEALARMSYCNLQRHSRCPPATLRRR
jgi:hypothetical protein